MKSLGQLLMGLFSAVGVSLLILSAFSLALLEGGTAVSGPAPLPEVSPTTQPSPATIQTQGGTVSTSTAPAVVTATKSVSSCPPPPAGWVTYTVQPGETLEAIAARAGVAVERVLTVNCLPFSQLVANMQIYLPFAAPTNTVPAPLPTAPPTATVGPCLPPAGWIIYTVRSGDTLFSLGRAYGVTAFQLQVNNCLPSDRIYAGQRLYVPNVPTVTPTSTRMPTETPEPSSTNTLEPKPDEPTSTEPATTATTTVPATATSTSEPTATETPQPAATNSSTAPAVEATEVTEVSAP